jgi:hypothetical protein
MFRSLARRCNASAVPPTSGPVGIDRKPFSSDVIRRALLANTPRFASPMWVTHRQLAVLRMHPRRGEQPLRIPSLKSSSLLEIYNVQQLQNAAPLVHQAPQLVDGVEWYGLDAFTLARQHGAPTAPGAPQPTKWYSVPDGLRTARMRAKADAPQVQVVLGFGRERRALSVISELHVEPHDWSQDADVRNVPTAASLSSTAAHDHADFMCTIITPGEERAAEQSIVELERTPRFAPAARCFAPGSDEALDASTVFTPHDEAALDGAQHQQPPHASAGPETDVAAGAEVFHVTSRGTLFGGTMQLKLQTIAAKHGYKSRTWYAPHTRSAQFREGAQQHIVNFPRVRFVLINADNVVQCATPHTDDGQHISAGSQTRFRGAANRELQAFATARGFKSVRWFTARHAQRQALTPRPGEQSITLTFGSSQIQFFNEEQLQSLLGTPANSL